MFPTEKKTKADLRAGAAERRLVDEYGDLVLVLAPFKADIARVSALATAIRALHADSDPATEFTVEGDHFVCVLGPKSNETRIYDMDDVFDALGRKAFLANCSMTLAALTRAGLPALQIEGLTTKEQTGFRPPPAHQVPRSSRRASPRLTRR